ncbi:MAG: hypothetical protein GY841_17990 [FCB group bacterium]|nr:hypothetical protein [FCB group bacterium]
MRIIRILVDKKDTERAKRLGDERYEICKAVNHRNDFVPYRDRWGALGEIAFGKHYGLPVNEDFSKSDGGYDFIINGWKIDVKTTPAENGRYLLLRKPAQYITDLYVAARWGTRPWRIELFGWATGLEMSNADDAPAHIAKHHPAYGIHANKLHAMDSFNELIRKEKHEPCKTYSQESLFGGAGQTARQSAGSEF